MASSRFGRSRPSRLARLVESGRIEVVLAASLAAIVILLELATRQPWPGIVLDLVTCTAAAATARWPRAAGVALGAIGVVYLVIPDAWGTLGEYALLIPILGAGMRGNTRLRAAFTLGYFPILAGRSLVLAPDITSGLLGWIVWGVLIGFLWLIGNAFVAVTVAHRQARAAALVLQRQELSRELHDTIARSLSKVSMAAERARLRGGASPDDLRLISDTAAEGIRELRWVMNLLRSPVELDSLSAQRRTPLDEALAAAEDDLVRHGFVVALSVEGDPRRLPPQHADALGAATGEAVANIIKYGDPASPSAIVADLTGADAELVFLNTTRTAEPTAEAGGGTGLAALRQRLEGLGGELSTTRSDRQWRTRVRLPLETAERPPRQAA